MKYLLGTENYKPQKEFLICVDSDGCAFDTMEIKHKECFCPSVIEVWDLQPVSRYVREAWEYVNLYSVMRGINRFLALIETFRLLEERKEVNERGFVLPNYEELIKWSHNNPNMNNKDLERYSDSPILSQALKWSLDCNKRINHMVRGIPPFPNVKESLQKAAEFADIVVVSATAEDALLREWEEGGLISLIHRICGQESGGKADCIKSIHGHYSPEKRVMIGDAIGDLKASKAGKTLFYPITPGEESRSWNRFLLEDIENFKQLLYDKEEKKRIDEYCGCLLTEPPWI